MEAKYKMIVLLFSMLFLCCVSHTDENHDLPNWISNLNSRRSVDSIIPVQYDNHLTHTSHSARNTPKWERNHGSKKPHKKVGGRKQWGPHLNKRNGVDEIGMAHEIGLGTRKYRGRNGKSRRHDKIRSYYHHHRNHAQEFLMQKQPTFDDASPSIVKAQVGSHSYLACKIHNLDDKAVSWIRNRDAHILTVDRYTFISDSRFVSLYDPDTGTWTLQVKFTTPEDAGRYECQVSTEPKKSHFVTLDVIVPNVAIPGGPELYVKSGSDVKLKCIISSVLSSPPYVFWYHEDKRVHERSSNLGGFIHQSDVQKLSDDSSVASLRITNVKKSHAGNYTCAPAGISTSASVLLHVLNGEHPAAMQHESNDASSLLVIASNKKCIWISIFTYVRIWIRS